MPEAALLAKALATAASAGAGSSRALTETETGGVIGGQERLSVYFPQAYPRTLSVGLTLSGVEIGTLALALVLVAFQPCLQPVLLAAASAASRPKKDATSKTRA